MITPYYGSSARTEQRVWPFSGLFTNGHAKSHQKTYCFSQRINSALTNTFFPAFLQLKRTWKKYRLYFTMPLRGNTHSGVFQSVCLTQEKNTTPSHIIYKLFIPAKCQPLAQRAQSSAGDDCAPQSHLETSREKQCTLWSKQVASEGTLVLKMFLGCWLPVHLTAEDWFPHLMDCIALARSKVLSPPDHLLLARKMV